MVIKIAKLINNPKMKKVKNLYSLVKIYHLIRCKPIKNHIMPQQCLEIKSNNKTQTNFKSQAYNFKNLPALQSSRQSSNNHNFHELKIMIC